MAALLLAVLLHSVQAAPIQEPFRLYVGLPTDMIIAAGDLGEERRAQIVADFTQIVRKDKKPIVAIADDRESAQGELYITYAAMRETGQRTRALFMGVVNELAYDIRGELRVGDKRYPIEMSEANLGSWKTASARFSGRVDTFVANNRALLGRQ